MFNGRLQQFNPQLLPLCVRHCKVIVPAGDCRLFDITHLSRITGCAVAQHCYNGDVSFLWEKWKLWPPVKSKPLNRVTHNLSGLIMSTRWTFVPNLVKNPFTGDFWAKGWNITFCVTFLNLFKSYLFICLFFFSDQRREETPGRILTRNGSKDAESRKDVSFCCYKMKKKTMKCDPYLPQTVKIWSR